MGTDKKRMTAEGYYSVAKTWWLCHWTEYLDKISSLPRISVWGREGDLSPFTVEWLSF